MTETKPNESMREAETEVVRLRRRVLVGERYEKDLRTGSSGRSRTT